MNRPLQGPRVHLWTFNHPHHGISDQVDFFRLAMAQQDLPATVGDAPRPDALNVVIENFSISTARRITEFARETGKRVSVIMTEHLDIVDGELRIHGDPLWSANDYMRPKMQADRLRHLMDLVPFVRALLCLGDLPELRGFDRALPGTPIRHIPFPRLPYVEPMPATATPPRYDLAFAGFLTRHREAVLEALRPRFSLTFPPGFVPHAERDRVLRSARLVLNLPQRPGWKWLSLMRIIATLRCGRATVSLGTSDTTAIAACCEQIDSEAQDWIERLEERVRDWVGLYDRAYRAYDAMATAFEQKRPFPHDFFEYWAVAERVHPVRSASGVS